MTTPTPPLEGKDQLGVELSIQLQNGITFPVQMYLVYPAGMGYHAVQAGAQMFSPEKREDLWTELLAKEDTSMLAAVKESNAQAAAEQAAAEQEAAEQEAVQQPAEEAGDA